MRRKDLKVKDMTEEKKYKANIVRSMIINMKFGKTNHGVKAFCSFILLCNPALNDFCYNSRTNEGIKVKL